MTSAPGPATSPSPPSRRRRRATGSAASRAARTRLLEAGTRLIAEQGLEAINTNVIARAARVGVGTFYGHFEDKHDFHRAVVANGLEVVREALAAAHERARARSIPDQVRAGVTALVDVAEARPHLFRATFLTRGPAARGAAGPTAGGAVRRGGVLGLSSRPIEQRLRALQREGAIHADVDPALAARAFTDMQVGAVCAWLDDAAPAPRASLIETLTRMHPALACRSD